MIYVHVDVMSMDVMGITHTCGVFALLCGDFIGTSLLHTASCQCNSTTSKA